MRASTAARNGIFASQLNVSSFWRATQALVSSALSSSSQWYGSEISTPNYVSVCGTFSVIG
jgi:hypothetical protein